ncbi:MAG: hypothetical protein JOY90_06320 [Bradyrhizobium sp.]|nr:hypothetical protein [Bradyrhizobium sp.]
MADSLSARTVINRSRSSIPRGTASTPHRTTLREVMLLAISDICTDVGEAFTSERAGRKFVWRRMRHFL